MASSSTTQTKTSDNQQNESTQTSETDYESNKVTSTSSSANVKKTAIKQRLRAQGSTSLDQSKKRSPYLFQQKFHCPFAAAPLTSSFFSSSITESYRGSPTQRTYARPYDEYAVGPLNTDAQSGTSTKPNDSSSSSTVQKP